MAKHIVTFLAAVVLGGSTTHAGFYAHYHWGKPGRKALTRNFGNADTGCTPLCMSVPNALDTLTSGLASIFCLPNGVTVSQRSLNLVDKPPRLAKLFDVENSSQCRIVREIITELDLVVELVIPATTNSRAIQDKEYKYALPESCEVPTLIVVELSGEEKVLSGKDAIVEYFDETIGGAEEPDTNQEIIGMFKEARSLLAGTMRIGRGTRVSAAATLPNENIKPLTLYSYEGNQFCRLVREVLTELDLVYELRSVGKESPRRPELASLTGGSTQCPYIVDPNTSVSMAESADIIRYLYKTYSRWTPPNELLEWSSDKIVPLVSPLFKALAPIQAGSNREDIASYQRELDNVASEIEKETKENAVVLYTYQLSPFCSEAKGLLDNLGIEFEEISLGLEWVPGLISKEGSLKRAALLEITGQSSLPHAFVGGKSVGGLFSGDPGLVPALKQGKLLGWIENAVGAQVLKPEI